MRLFYVYILLCADNTFYVGVTNDMLRRMQEHHQGLNADCYTKSRLPVELKFHEMYVDPSEAFRREKQIKKWSQAKKIALINEDWELLKQLSKSKKS